MSEETDALFTALSALEDVREILRDTAPTHELSEAEKELYMKKLVSAKKAIERLEALL